MDQTEESLFNNMFDSDNQRNSTISRGGIQKVIIDDDCEMTFNSDENAFKPPELGYQVKIKRFFVWKHSI